MTDVPGEYQWILNLDSPVYLPGSLMIQFHVTDELAALVESQPFEVTQAEAMRRLRNTFGNDIPDPVDIFVTNWSNNPNTFGSYSNWPLGYTEAEWLAMSRTEGRLFFAGEHMSDEYFGYLHGAYFSGIGVADGVVSAIESEGITSNSNGLSGAEITGVTVGCVVGVGLTVSVMALMKKREADVNANEGKEDEFTKLTDQS